MDLILKYFPDLSPRQEEQLRAMLPFYSNWNSKINLISRKDMEHFYERHVLHSLSIARYISFKPNTTILDVGTGGGFPGIPLAILVPEADFLLTDSIGKKIMVVKQAVQELGLNNVTAINKRAEEIKFPFDFIISRAVTNLPDFVNWTLKNIRRQGNNQKPNGILYLKGGDVSPELNALPKKLIKVAQPLSQYFSEPWFETKYLIHIY